VALWFPRLSTDRLQRRWKRTDVPPPDAPPLVVVAKEGNAQIIAALDRKATALGLCVGQPLATARAMVPALKAVAANAPADLKLLHRIADWCDRFTPFVALDPPRGVLLDVTGVAHLFAGEQAMLDTILESLRGQDFIVRGALAGTALAARALARHRDGSVVTQGHDSEAIAPLPIDALCLGPVTTHAFRRAGLKTVAQAAGRKRAELAARFGTGLVQTFDAALARAETPITPRRPLPNYSVERNFAEPIATEDAIRDTLTALAASLSESLEKHGEGARRLEAAFFRADGVVRRLEVETGAPVRDPRIVERLFREKLASLVDPLDPGFGFDLIRLSAGRVERTGAALQDFDVEGTGEIRFLIDRLAARFGAHRVLVFRPNDTHIPEAAWVAVPAQHAQGPQLAWEQVRRSREAPRRPLRLFAKPESLALLGASPRLGWRGTQRAVTCIEGPERIAMEWWRHQDEQPARDYFRAEDEEGRRLWLYRDMLTLQWCVHGVFA
jgi:protein ImuB